MKTLPVLDHQPAGIRRYSSMLLQALVLALVNPMVIVALLGGMVILLAATMTYSTIGSEYGSLMHRPPNALGMGLPPPTQFAYEASSWILHNWPLAFLGLILVAALTGRYLNLRPRRWVEARWLWTASLFSYLLILISMIFVRFLPLFAIH